MWKNIRKKILAVLMGTGALVICILAGILGDMSDNLVSYAADSDIPVTSGSSFDVFIDENNDINIITNDQIKTGSIYYRTIGFSISRGQFNPSAKKLANAESTEYFNVTLQDMTKETKRYGTREINCFKYPFASCLSKMSAEWQQEIQDAQERGMTAYIRFDAFMVVYKGTAMLSHLYVNTPPYGPYDDETLDRNPKELQNAYGWSAGSNTGIKTHYHRWLPISSSAIITEPILTDWHVTKQTSGGPGTGIGTSSLTYYGDYTGDPEYAGGNANLEGYNTALGIPSTKTVTGYAESSPWFGNLDVWARLVTHQYSKTDTYTWKVSEGVEYDGSPIKDAGTIQKKLKDAVDTMEEDRDDEEDRIKPLLADKHDTPINEIFHYYFYAKYVDDANKTVDEVVIGRKNPTVSDHTYSANGYSYIPKWQYGWSWTTFDGYEQMLIQTGVDEDGNPQYDNVDDPSRPIYTNHEITWSDHTNPSPKPSGDNIVSGPSAEYTNGRLVYCEYKLTAIDAREYFDDNYNYNGDKYVQAYAAFEYIDPFKTNFYDLNSVTLYNDVYGTMTFPQVVDTEMDAQKGSIKTNSTVTFDAWLETAASAGTVDSKLIATTDYIKWAEIEDEEKGKLEKSYDDDSNEVKKFISDNTKSLNDYIYVKNPIDNGPEDGIYLGNNAAGGYGIVTGCDFRDAETLSGYESLGKIDPILSGTGSVVTGDNVYTSEDNSSKYWYLCVHSAGGNEEKANAYTSDNQSKLNGVIKVWEKLEYQTQNIEPETANGEHSTGMSTLYVQEIIGPATATSVMQYVDQVTDGHLYSDSFGESGSQNWSTSSRWGGLMGSSEGGMDADGNILAGPGSTPSVDGSSTGDVSFIVDPVQIHTPIMSPGTIVNSDGDETTRESGSTTRNSDGSTSPASDTSLYNDVSKTNTSQLRLDKYYYIKWQDLSDVGTTHRQDAATPEYGGYASQTDDSSTEGLEEDQFTKAKYFKFPFEVMYDGKYYKANQWIEVKNPNSYDEDGDAADNAEGYLRDANPETASATADKPGELTSENHWVLTPFYIPSWAAEGLYEDIENANPYDPQDLTTCAQLRVDAINVSETDTSGNTVYRADEVQELANTYYNISSSTYDDGAAYVAQYNYPVQLSGWIYDFTITGISDIDNFGTNTWNATGEDAAGTQDTDAYFSNSIASDYAYSFTAHMQDKKSGLLNRFGLPGIRYLKDGSINMNWDQVNTVALVGAWAKNGTVYSGKSNSWPSKGTVVKGTTFAFTLKTMSNMWNFNGKDSISITPTFTYHKYDAASNTWMERTNEQLKIYYDESDSNMFIPYGSSKDLNIINSAALGETQFDQSYYTAEDTVSGKTFGDWIWYNTYNYNLNKGLIPAAMTLSGFKSKCETDPESLLNDGAYTPELWLSEKVDEYCLSAINIPERMRLLSGEADQLMSNNLGTSSSSRSRIATDSNFVTPKTYVGSTYGKEYTTSFNSSNELVLNQGTPTITIYENSGKEEKDITMDDKFRYSIQSWYAKYYVPQELYVIDLTEHPEFRDFDDPLSPYHSMVNADGSVQMPDGNRYWDYMEYYVNQKYLEGSSVGEDDEVFLRDGYLAVNFDIIAIKNGEEHLVYSGGNVGTSGANTAENEEEIHDNTDNDVWKNEGNPEIPDDIDPPSTNTEEGVPTDNGDVVIIKLDEKFKDRFNAAIFNIN